MYNKRSVTLVAALLSIALALPAFAVQDPTNGSDIKVNAAVRTEVINRIAQRLNELYVFPEVAKKIEESLLERMKNGEYENIESGREFARTLTEHLQYVSRDKHMRVRCNDVAVPEPNGDHGPSAEERARFSAMLKANNYGFERVERLPGNIGYLRFDHFAPADEAGDTVAAAMNFLANTSALIVDLRHNGGGSPEMVALFCSYFFDADPVHLNDLYFRPANETRQFWTLPHLPGKRYLGKDVYVLTSKRTFSGAEECCYNLQTQKRATLIGETTGGGANPGGPRWVHPHFSIFIPTGRAINPITKTNWEGTGVKPEVEVPADKALKTAQVMALKKAVEKATDAEQKSELSQILERLQKESDSASKSAPFDWTLGTWSGLRKDGRDGTKFKMTMHVRQFLDGSAINEEMEVNHPSSTYQASSMTVYDTARKVWQMQYVNSAAGKRVPMDAEIADGKVSWRSVNPNRTHDSKLLYEHSGPNTWKRI